MGVFRILVRRGRREGRQNLSLYTKLIKGTKIYLYTKYIKDTFQNVLSEEDFVQKFISTRNI